MSDLLHYPSWREKVVYPQEGLEPQVLFEDDRVRVVLAGLRPGQRIPPHPEVRAVFHCLDGQGWMMVGGRRLEFNAGATVIVPGGVARGVEADSRLAFLAVRLP